MRFSMDEWSRLSFFCEGGIDYEMEWIRRWIHGKTPSETISQCIIITNKHIRGASTFQRQIIHFPFICWSSAHSRMKSSQMKLESDSWQSVHRFIGKSTKKKKICGDRTKPMIRKNRSNSIYFSVVNSQKNRDRSKGDQTPANTNEIDENEQNEDSERNEEFVVSMFIVHNILTIELHESVIIWLMKI